MSNYNTISQETFYKNEDKIVEEIVSTFENRGMTVEDMNNNFLFTYDVVNTLLQAGDIKLNNMSN